MIKRFMYLLALRSICLCQELWSSERQRGRERETETERERERETETERERESGKEHCVILTQQTCLLREQP